MGARTIDEGAMDEKSGMNFSEYMALLSGNTDLLDKAKLEKRIASLEGERKSFNKGKRDSEFKLESKTGELRNNTAFIDAMTEDWNRFLSGGYEYLILLHGLFQLLDQIRCLAFVSFNVLCITVYDDIGNDQQQKNKSHQAAYLHK